MKTAAYRLPTALLDRLARVTRALRHDPTYTLHGALSRSDVVRLALTHGLDRLEARAAPTTPEPRPETPAERAKRGWASRRATMERIRRER
jgi:hypothetical protein